MQSEAKNIKNKTKHKNIKIKLMTFEVSCRAPVNTWAQCWMQANSPESTVF